MSLDNGLRRIGLYGVRGVGKSTLIEEVVRIAPEFHPMDGTTYVTRAAGMPLADFKKLDANQKKRVRRQAIDIAFDDQIQIGKDFLVAGHLAFPDSSGEIVPVLTGKDLDFYTEYIYLDLPSKTIFDRQRSDHIKRREYPLSLIESWKKYEVDLLRSICSQLSIGLSFIRSVDLEDSVQELLRIIQ